MFQLLPKCPRAIFAPNQKFCPQNAFWGPRLAVVTPHPYTKIQSKIEKLTFAGRRFKSRFFSVANAVQILKAVAMGVVAACGTFLAR
jgi:hypothetical protein